MREHRTFMNNREHPLLVYLLFAAASWGLCFTFAVVSYALGSKSLSAASKFADSFNIITSLFTGFAFAATAYAIHLQGKQRQDTLQISKNEIDYNKRILRLSKIESLIKPIQKLKIICLDLPVLVIYESKSKPYDSVRTRLLVIDLLSEADGFAKIYFNHYCEKISDLRDSSSAYLDSLKQARADAVAGKSYTECLENLSPTLDKVHDDITSFINLVCSDNSNIIDLSLDKANDSEVKDPQSS